MAAVLGGLGGALIGGATSLIGDFMGMSGQQQTNAAMMQQQLQMEQWQQMMSDTAMQRRVKDLKAAGLNPMLAIGQGGASTPGISPVNLGNPGASFGNLGSQMTNAMQTGAAIDNLQANSEKLRADAALTKSNIPGNLVPLDENGDPDFTRADGGTLGNLNAAQAYQQIQNAKATWGQIKADTAQKTSTTNLNDAQRALTGINADTARMMQQTLVDRAMAELKLTRAELPELEAQAKIMSSPYGVWIKALQAILGSGPLGSALGAAAGAALGARGNRAAPLPGGAGGKYEPNWSK